MIATRAQPEIGGIESHVAEVAGRIAARGYDLELLTTDRSGRLPRRE
ncbi:MAG: alpha,3-mannosyltransferase, partial [Nocardioidaceae bacterium]|nr:alpha,3-mannosyltransferase [Nocardioidaceae bacterium]